MSWKDRLKKGSFRGVPFFTASSEVEGGRRGQVHEYPGSDSHTIQDLGIAAKRFTVTAFLIGEDYDIQRNNLIEALDKGGPGKLVHRYYGELTVEVEPNQRYRVTESQDQGGMATFQIPFIVSGKQRKTTVGIDTVARIKTAADKAKASSQAGFLKRFLATGPEFVRDNIIGTVDRATAKMSGINRQVHAALSLPNGLAASITSLGNTTAYAVAAPTRYGDLVQGMYNVHSAIFGAITNVGAALVASAAVFGSFGSTSIPSEARADARKAGNVLRSAQSGLGSLGDDEPHRSRDTDLNTQMADNQDAIVRLNRQAAAIEAARAAASMPYESRDAALAMLEQLDSALTELAESSDDDDVFAALSDLRVEVAAHLNTTAGELPRLVEYKPARTLSSLLIAHLVHGDARRHDEIISRNNPRHPGFMEGAKPVLVLNA